MSDTQKTKNRTSDTLKTKNRGSDKIRRGRTSQIEERSNRGEEHSNEPFSDDSDLDTKRLTKHTGKACRKRAKICSSRRYPMYNDGGPTTVLQSLSLSLSLSLGLNSTVIVSLNLVLCLSSVSSLSQMTCRR
jgi:hypothetical protein